MARILASCVLFTIAKTCLAQGGAADQELESGILSVADLSTAMSGRQVRPNCGWPDNSIVFSAKLPNTSQLTVTRGL